MWRERDYKVIMDRLLYLYKEDNIIQKKPCVVWEVIMDKVSEEKKGKKYTAPRKVTEVKTNQNSTWLQIVDITNWGDCWIVLHT